MEPAAVTTDSRTTKGITHEQRYHLCLKKQECPAMKQSELAAWFNETYSFPISQPTISHSLKKSAEILARGITSPGVEPTRVRRRPVRHPELEQAIFRWVQEQQQKQQQEQKVGQQQQQQSGDDDSDPISGPVLIRQAKKIAREMNMVDTVFCPGWLTRFKVRYGIASSRGSNNRQHHLDQHCRRNHGHHSQHNYQRLHQRRQRRHLQDQDQDQQQQQPQPEFEAPRVVKSITISNHSCSPPATNQLPTPSDTICSNRTTNNSTLTTIEIRPSIAVPSNINSSHASLQQLRPLHSNFGSIHILPSSGDVNRQSLHQQRQQQLQQLQQQQQEHHRDAQLLQQFRTQTFPQPTSRSTHLHSHSQQATVTATSEITAAMHLEFLQSIPITPPTNGNVLHPSSLPPSPLSHHTASLLRPNPTDPFQSSSSMERPISSGSKLDTSALGKVQSLQEAQRLVQLLRQYAGSYLQDPTGALKSLESLEWELDPTRMRGSITISEMGDDHD
ncbi:hypothetical protein BGX33_012052 [Mortierella sp. NVP41]|nr:hypothetical protein BGX33_012052 [Mortierella sp. NVP41]